MELRDCECFVAVAEELHFGRAAARLGLAQPPLSQRIKALEAELGTRLFARTSRRVEPTAAGRAFLAEARAVLDRAARAKAMARAVGQGLGGRLAVGFVNPAMDAFLSETLAAFRRDTPRVALTLRELPTREQVAALGAGQLDLGFVRQAGQVLPDLESRVVFRERYLAALPAGHVLAAGKGRVDLSRLAGEPFVFPPRAALPQLHEAMRAALAKAGREPEVAQEATSKFTVLSLVAAGLGVALVPASAGVWRRRGVVLREVAGELPRVELAAVWPRGRLHPAAGRLLALLGTGA